jgi:uncharacterized phage protein (TIGR01671 family)
MPNMKLTVPVELSRNDEGFWLNVQTKTGKAASILLDALPGGIIRHAFVVWAEETMYATFFNKRRKTGLKDSQGREIAEGDIISRPYNEFYDRVTGVIKWDTDKAAFIAEGSFEGGGGWGTNNLEGAKAWHVIGNILQNPGFLVPAVKKDA